MGKRGPKKQPTEILRLKGTFAKNPKRGRERELEPPPSVDGDPQPPDHLGEIGKEAYRQAVKDLKSLNCLSSTDAKSIEAFAAIYEQWRETKGERGWIQTTSALHKLLSELGFSPSARTNLKMNEPDKSKLVRARTRA